jgi:hypothetical protein
MASITQALNSASGAEESDGFRTSFTLGTYRSARRHQAGFSVVIRSPASKDRWQYQHSMAPSQRIVGQWRQRK